MASLLAWLSSLLVGPSKRSLDVSGRQKNEILDFSVLTSDPCLLQIKRRKTLPYSTLFGNIRVHLIVGSA